MAFLSGFTFPCALLSAYHTMDSETGVRTLPPWTREGSA